MATQGSNILASDYNTIQTSVANILGVGSSNSGYGQNLNSGQVAQGSTITAAQWANLKADIIACANHQGTISTGDASITALSNLTITNNPAMLVYAADANKFSNALTVINNNKLYLGTGQFTTANLVSSQRTNSPWGSPTKPTVTHSFYIQWSSANAARYFWNSGGYLTFTASLTNNSSTPQNNDWVSTLSAMGTIKWSLFNTSKVPSAPGTSASSGTTSNITWYDLGTSSTAPTQIYKKTGTGGNYTSNDYKITAYKSVDLTTLYVNINFDDNHNNPYDDGVSGTLTSTVNYGYSTGSVVYSPSSHTAANSINLTQ